MRNYFISVATALAVTAVAPSSAMAQQRTRHSARAQSVEATRDMRSRLAAAGERVRVTEHHGKIAPTRSAALQQRLVRAEHELTRLSRGHGYVSSAKLASYGRMVEATDAELGAAATGASYQHDALPSAEVTAFQETDARLHYRNARIEYDGRQCAVYQGVARGGQTRREPLLDPSGRPICARQ